jgi:hypothetical protein
MTVLFSDGYECPPNTAPGTFTAWTAKSGSVTIDNTQPRSGTYAMKTTATSQYIGKNLGASYADLFMRFYIYFPVFTTRINIGVLTDASGYTNGNYVVVGAQKNGANLQFYIYFYGSGTFHYPSVIIQAGQWYCVEIERLVGAGTGAINIWIDGANLSSTTGLTLANNAQYCCLGQTYAATNLTYYIDDVVISDSYIGPSGIQKFCLLNEMGY